MANRPTASSRRPRTAARCSRGYSIGGHPTASAMATSSAIAAIARGTSPTTAACEADCARPRRSSIGDPDSRPAVSSQPTIAAWAWMSHSSEAIITARAGRCVHSGLPVPSRARRSSGAAARCPSVVSAASASSTSWSRSCVDGVSSAERAASSTRSITPVDRPTARLISNASSRHSRDARGSVAASRRAARSMCAGPSPSWWRTNAIRPRSWSTRGSTVDPPTVVSSASASSVCPDSMWAPTAARVRRAR
ncbi:hypothetical protein [Virgisporangium ochraceum]|uniref:hypothetical protein n=1 Tax=Virgisporangium ochraceum TaxID=65505 RepID=UPI0019439C62|nr:hypothetical protein [Virgisporangium ochraceum]